MLGNRVQNMLGWVKYQYLTTFESLIKGPRSTNAALNTFGSAVQMIGLEPHNETEDKHVLPYFLYSGRKRLVNYSDPWGVLHYTHVKICHNNVPSFL